MATRSPVASLPVLASTKRALIAPAVVREAVRRWRGAPPSADALARLEHWQHLLSDDAARRELNEESYKAEFLLDIFERLLGFASVSAGPIYHLHRERPGVQDSRPADAILGWFEPGGSRTVRAVVEIKPPGTNLDGRSARTDRLSPVDQAFLYASNFTDVHWALVSNFDEIRLYSVRRGKTHFERFWLQQLAGAELQSFQFLLRREHLIGDTAGVPLVLQLAEQTWREQAEITHTFYAEYQEARAAAFAELRRQNPQVAATELLKATQLLLDRLLFILFCVDRHIIPHDTLARLRAQVDPCSYLYHPSALWQGVRALFRAVDQGSSREKITAFNGGLFAPALLDELRLDHEDKAEAFVLDRLLDWDSLDFESQLDVDVLGHVFENSISDLEQLERELAGSPTSGSLAWRNRQGVFYTPAWVTGYIVKGTVERYLDEHPEVGEDFKVLDPACGSGAFLVNLIPTLAARLRQLAPSEVAAVERGARRGRGGRAARGVLPLFEDPELLEPRALYAAVRRSVFGVDKSEESVEITRLAFWLKMVVSGNPLPPLAENVVVGNSLIADPEIAPDALDWAARLPHLDGRTHVVVGNPPWGADLSPYAGGLAGYELAAGQAASEYLFVELALRLLATGGYLGFVLPDSLLVNEETERLRRMLLQEHTILEVIKLGEGVFPSVYRSCIVLIVRKEPPPPDHTYRALVVARGDRRQITDVASAVDLDVLMARRGVTVRAADCLGRDGAELIVHLGQEDRQIFAKIEARSMSWDDVCTVTRGIELNSDGWVVQCPACMQWDAPPLKRQGVFLLKRCRHCGHEYTLERALGQATLVTDGEAPPDTGAHAVYLDGSDFSRYVVTRRRWIDVGRRGIDYKAMGIYASPKILFRQAGFGITATLDVDMNALVPQSTYLIGLREGRDVRSAGYRLEYILGVLNSRLLLYHFSRANGIVEHQSFPRWTMGRVRALPVRAIDWASAAERRRHDRIAELVASLVASAEGSNSDIDWEIESEVLALYGISGSERERIWSTLQAIEGVEVVSRVVPQRAPEARIVAA